MVDGEMDVDLYSQNIADSLAAEEELKRQYGYYRARKKITI